MNRAKSVSAETDPDAVLHRQRGEVGVRHVAGHQLVALQEVPKDIDMPFRRRRRASGRRRPLEELEDLGDIAHVDTRVTR
ncbi:hypothetical protein C8D89_104263 [Actinomycetospora cinnamomea]|uniref:Uncharacterized protein n=1 Tax=Actinomycetospora cinnamomea TaxID=663609 RepID=A0A2U1FFW7_9PSEU|nr:hypothetical protein C8D89_104263 [Actinomycetospora cinnamomea]